MENNLINELLKNSEELKKMKAEISEGKIPDLKAVLPFLAKIPSMMEEASSNLTEEQKKELQPFLDEIKKKADIGEILKQANADRSN